MKENKLGKKNRGLAKCRLSSFWFLVRPAPSRFQLEEHGGEMKRDVFRRWLRRNTLEAARGISRKTVEFAQVNPDCLFFYQPVMNVQNVQGCSETVKNPTFLQTACTDTGFGRHRPGGDRIPVNRVLRPRRWLRYGAGKREMCRRGRKTNSIIDGSDTGSSKKVQPSLEAAERVNSKNNSRNSFSFGVNGSNKAMDISQFI